MGRVSPHLFRPRHFAEYATRIECSVSGELRIAFSAPPQHGKTDLTLHGFVWLAKNFPDKRHAYITYNADRATCDMVAGHFRRLLAEAGIIPRGTLHEVRWDGGGQVIFRGIDGGVTGYPVDGLCVIDDAIKDRSDCTKARLDIVEERYHSAIETRVHPGASIVLMGTRWDRFDLHGRLKEQGWEVINLPALAEENDPNGRAVGEALFPEKWPAQELAKKRARTLEFTWQALFQGHPRPLGGKIFHEPTWYTKLPTVYSGIYGLDLACTAKTSSDWSVCVELWREERKGQEPLYYVVHVDRAQIEAPDYALTLKARHVKRPDFKMIWRAVGMEKGSAQFLNRVLWDGKSPERSTIKVLNPPGDKLVSATGVAAAWNDGRVLLPDIETFPAEESWVIPFLDIVRDFTGNGKEHDDDVDALGNGFDALERMARRPVDVGGSAAAPSRGNDRVV